MTRLKEQPLDCWACELAKGYSCQHITRWFWLTDSGIVVEDLNAKEYDLRLLFVPSFHLPVGKELNKDHEFAKDILSAVAERHLPEYEIVAYDLTDHSYKAHWHAQAGLRRKKDGAR